MAVIYFVTEQFLKDNTNVGKGVDMNNATPLIKTAADMYTRSVLGTYFYNDLLTKFNAQTLSADETTLVADYIKPTVAWRAAADIVIGTTLQVKNKGVVQQSGDYSSSADFKSMAFLSHHTTQNAEFYQSRLFTYLVDNKALFTNFTSDLNTDSTAKLACYVSNQYDSGILFI